MMPQDHGEERFIMMPADGFRVRPGTPADGLRPLFFTFAGGARRTAARSFRPAGLGRSAAGVRVLDSVSADGPKLIAGSPEAMLSLRAQYPRVQFLPERFYRRTSRARMRVASRPRRARGRSRRHISLTITDRATGAPLGDAYVVAFTDFASGEGDEGATNSRGHVRLQLGASRRTVQRLYIYPPTGYWGAFRRRAHLTSATVIPLRPVSLSYTDALRHFYGEGDPRDGRGVRVAVVDGGIDGAHADLNVAGGENTALGEAVDDYGDDGSGHGTHVAGIIAARGTPPSGLRGVAPGVKLYAFRVFEADADTASNFAIQKAISRAVDMGCHLINLSLGSGDPDPVIESALRDARDRGVVAIAATGNESRDPVNFPAASAHALAVSALGRRGTFPRGALERGDVARPNGKDRKNFVAAFSNIGAEVDLTGPGVGVLSTLPGGYGPMSGTSMACPAITGVAARLLSSAAHRRLLRRRPGRSRADAIAQVVIDAARPMGFGPKYEGHGRPAS